MDDFIKGLMILREYLKDKNSQSPFHCEHDIICIQDIDPEVVSYEDKVKLKELGFVHGNHEANGYEPCFYSYRFGSA
jgi:hypothetical protein